MRNLTPILTAIAVSFGTMTQAQTQQTDPNIVDQAPFASENAIIDTSIPFAIGAREAQQSLRGAFGWPTFQEGLVQGVYFRFDPDGYARFAPTPRLDTDVFEVICRPRTYSCMGRKGALSVILNSRGQMQLKIDDVQTGDRFFVSEGVSEIEVPERILQPLETQLELLLSSGGDLIVRRGDNEKDRISLSGFLAVSAYLRWVAARQDYSILPRGWPVPNAVGSDASVTQASTWQSPMPQPQNFPTGQNNLGQTQFQQAPQPLQIQVQPTIASSNQSEVDEVKSELKVLRELLMDRNQTSQAEQQNVPAQPAQTSQQAGMAGSIAQLMPQNATQQPVSDQIAALQRASAQIQADLQRLSQPVQHQTQTGLAQTTLNPTPQVQQTEKVMQAAEQSDRVVDPAMETAKRLQYLMTEIGLDAKTALMLIQLGEGEPQGNQAIATSVERPQPQEQQPVFQENVVAEILQELENDVLKQQQLKTSQIEKEIVMTEEEFVLLSQYFKSVVLDR